MNDLYDARAGRDDPETPGLTRDPDAWADAVLAAPADGDPVPRAVMLVDPTGFRVSSQSATDNVYIDVTDQVDEVVARAQFHGLVQTLLECGVPVLAFPGRPGLEDGVFPNNVFGTAPGRFVVGRMKHPVRRREAAREDVRGVFTQAFGLELHDLSDGPGLSELTGVMAIDRARRCAVCGLGSRADIEGTAAMHRAFDLRATLATPLDPREYHINIVFAVLAGRAAVVYAPSFLDPRAVPAIERAFGGRVLRLTDEEKAAFAGNVLAVTAEDVLLSATSFAVLRPEARAWYAEQGFRLHPVAVDAFEMGGGSLRCLVAEVFG